MENQKYGIGKQDFEAMIERGFVYVDKTPFIIKLLEGPDACSLSRPRRFGKSLFISTLEHFFLGHRHLFKGLAIDSYEWDWEEYPVIRIDFSNGSFSRPDGLVERLDEIINEIEIRYKVNTAKGSPRARLNSLITNLKEKYNKKVVILVDEYEKPLLDNIGRPEQLNAYRDELADFYSVFKNKDTDIRFLFLTGITRFGHLNIFSGLNNLADISLETRYDAICGITEYELRRYFTPGINNYANKNDISFEKALQELKEYYDGYHFSVSLKDIYNPFSLLSCLNQEQLLPVWIGTGMTSSLFYLIKNRDWDLTKIENIKADALSLMGIDAEFLAPVTLFYQTGYLTIKSFDRESALYTLGIPNMEVRKALYNAIIPFYLGKGNELRENGISDLSIYIKEGRAKEMMEWFQTFFSKVPYETKLRLREDKPNAERDFQFVVYAIFSLVCNFNRLHLEYSTAAGRSDIVIDSENFVYVIELKMGSTPKKALEQIEKSGYAVPWQSSGKKVIKIGAAFSSRSKGLLSFAISE